MGKKSQKTKEIAEGVVKVAGVVATIGGGILKALDASKKS